MIFFIVVLVDLVIFCIIKIIFFSTIPCNFKQNYNVNVTEANSSVDVKAIFYRIQTYTVATAKLFNSNMRYAFTRTYKRAQNHS